MELNVAGMNAKTDANARRIVPLQDKLATGLNGANVTRHVNQNTAAKG